MLTIATDAACIQGICIEDGEFRRVGPVSSGSHGGGSSKDVCRTGEVGVFGAEGTGGVRRSWMKGELWWKRQEQLQDRGAGPATPRWMGEGRGR